MGWYQNLKISVKLLSAFIIVALIAGVIGYIGVVKLHQIDDADTKLYEKITVPMGQLRKSEISSYVNCSISHKITTVRKSSGKDCSALVTSSLSILLYICFCRSLEFVLSSRIES